MNKQKNISETFPNTDICVRCGYCCNKRICSYGKDDGNGKCCFLKIVDKYLLVFSCTRRDEIRELEKRSNIPMFNFYCSSSLMNSEREEVIRKREEEIRKFENKK